MKTISAAAAAILCLSAAHAQASTFVRPGFYQALILYTSVNDPSGVCASQLGISPGGVFSAEAAVGGAGKPVVLNSVGVGANSAGLIIDTLTFSNLPASIKADPTNYSGTATGSQYDTGVGLSWTTGTINTIAADQFKATLTNVTVSYGGQPVCSASIDAAFVFTGP
jgi:hypothetical protein